jgi:DNA-binding NarL/FixJ family response regulator
MEACMRIAILDANEVSRIGLGMLLKSEPGVESVEMFAALDEFHPQKPDVVVMDVLPEGIAEQVRLVRERCPAVAMLLLSDEDSAQVISGFLGESPKSKAFVKRSRVGDLEDFMYCLRNVMAGRTVLDPSVVYRMTENRSPLLETLTRREDEVLSLISAGFTNTAIASMLFIQRRTVENHINRIFVKLGVSQDGTTHARVRAVLTYHKLN